MKLPTLPSLDGLIGLSRKDGVDVRPTLVRVLTDLYVQKPVHTQEEERRYTELALWLIPGVDEATRAAVANKLATYRGAPRLVVRRLARDVFEVAEPILKFSHALTGADLADIAADFGLRHAAAITARDAAAEAITTGASQSNADDATQAAGEDAGVEAVDRQALSLPFESTDATPADSESGSPNEADTEVELGERFLAADSGERLALLAKLEQSDPTQPAPSPAGDTVQRLEAAALEGRVDEFVRELEYALQIPRDTAQRIVRDEAGEPALIAAKAVAMPADVLLRVVLFLNPAVGQSVERVFALVDLYERLTPAAAMLLVASWREASAGRRRIARYQPLHWDDETRAARGGTLEHARRVGQVSDARSQPRRGDERPTRQRTT